MNTCMRFSFFNATSLYYCVLKWVVSVMMLQRLPLASIDILLYKVGWVGLHASHIHSVSSLNCLTKERFRLKLIKVGENLPILHSHVGDFSHTQLLSGSFSRAHLLNVVMSVGFTGLGVQCFYHSGWFWLWLKESLVWWFFSDAPFIEVTQCDAGRAGPVECTCCVVVQDFVSDRREGWKEIVSLNCRSQQLSIAHSSFSRVLH